MVNWLVQEISSVQFPRIFDLKNTHYQILELKLFRIQICMRAEATNFRLPALSTKVHFSFRPLIPIRQAKPLLCWSRDVKTKGVAKMSAAAAAASAAEGSKTNRKAKKVAKSNSSRSKDETATKGGATAAAARASSSEPPVVNGHGDEGYENGRDVFFPVRWHCDHHFFEKEKSLKMHERESSLSSCILTPFDQREIKLRLIKMRFLIVILLNFS